MTDMAFRQRSGYARGPSIRAKRPRRSKSMRFSSDGLFASEEVTQAFGLPCNEPLWRPSKAGSVSDEWSAMRYCIGLLRTRPDLRARFPRALSEGEGGAFTQWLVRRRLWPPLFGRFRAAIAAAFGMGAADAIRRILATRPDLRRHHPLAMTPAGLPAFIAWLLRHGIVEYPLRVEAIWWFALECAENPAARLVETYLFTPEWQRAVPDGLTVFGREDLADWLRCQHGLAATWADPRLWLLDLSPDQQIRLAYNCRQAWRDRHPGALTSLPRARALLHWLAGCDAALGEQARAFCQALDHDSIAAALTRGGANLLGHFRYVSGLRRAAEITAAALAHAGLGVSLRDVPVDVVADEPGWRGFLGQEVFETTIIHVEPEPYFATAFERSALAERRPGTHRIGFWYWELETVPAEWARAASRVDEIWVASDFVAKAMSPLGPPVLRMRPGIELLPFQPRPRGLFGLRDGVFTFLFAFHSASTLARKNPLGLIAAFRLAFGDDPSVALVLKTSHGSGHRDTLARLHDAAIGAQVNIIDWAMTDGDMLALMNACDCYVSLHRSEGFGLTLAEAMLLGKPVIATGWSGNIDFMHSRNSLLIDYRLVDLETDAPPYPAGARWAEPCIEHAARLMRRVRDNPIWAGELGALARTALRQILSVAAAGRRMADRLHEIRRLAGVRAPHLPKA
jgi:hypothetical protein